MGSQAIAQQIEIETRRTQVAELLRQHKNHRAIARALNISVGTVSTDVKAIRREWAERRFQDRDEWVAEELRRLAIAENAIWDQILDGKLFAIDRLLAIMQRRAGYLGLDAPLEINIRGEMEDYAKRRALELGMEEAAAIAAVERILKASR